MTIRPVTAGRYGSTQPSPFCLMEASRRGIAFAKGGGSGPNKQWLVEE
jgi:hypothetical protein